MKKVSLKQVAPFLILAAVAVVSLFIPSFPLFNDGGKYNSADIAWIIVATALVFLMTPGLAFFYGGMVHRKNVLSTMMKSVVAAGIVGVLWIVVGFSLAFGKDVHGFIGDPTTFFFFRHVADGAPWSLAPTIPLTLFALFQLMFAIITPGLVVGAVAERSAFSACNHSEAKRPPRTAVIAICCQKGTSTTFRSTKRPMNAIAHERLCLRTI